MGDIKVLWLEGEQWSFFASVLLSKDRRVTRWDSSWHFSCCLSWIIYWSVGVGPWSLSPCSPVVVYIQLSSFPRTTYWRGYLFSIVYLCLLCHRLDDHKCVSLALNIYILFHWSVFLFLCQHDTGFFFFPVCFNLYGEGKKNKTSEFI